MLQKREQAPKCGSNEEEKKSAAYNREGLWLIICACYPCEKELNTGLSHLSVRCWTGDEEGQKHAKLALRKPM
jgi:hypothetical protein